MKNILKTTLLFATFALIGGTKTLQTAQPKMLKITHAKQISSETIVNADPRSLYSIVKDNPKSADCATKSINENNITKIKSWSIIQLLIDLDKDRASQFAKCINESNFINLPHQIFEAIAEVQPSLTQQISTYVNQKNLLKVNSNVINKIAKQNSQFEERLKKMAQEVPTLNYGGLDLFLFNTEMFRNYMNILKIAGNKINLTEKKSFSHQDFARNWEGIIKWFVDGCNYLQKNPKARLTLSTILNDELKETKKGRYVLYHGRNSGNFVKDLIWMHLLELYHGKSINKDTWYAQHWRHPKNNFPYHKVAQLVKNGRGGLIASFLNFFTCHIGERDSMQFFSNLWSYKYGSSALTYVLENRNAGDNGPVSFSIQYLFSVMNLEKYYKTGCAEFQEAEKLAENFKYGTMLAYSFTPEALKKFTYATWDDCGRKCPIKVGDSWTTDPKVVLDTLLNNREKIEEGRNWYEYVMVISNNHPKNKTKLGSASPFNPNIRIRHYNFGDDAKIAQEIKALVKKAFIKIKKKMDKDKFSQASYMKPELFTAALLQSKI